ncbi:MAG: DLW-39 family protein [Beutenbergiaceae bacterium]
MKRGLIVTGVLITAAVLIWRKLEEQREQRELWIEVTDPLP